MHTTCDAECFLFTRFIRRCALAACTINAVPAEASAEFHLQTGGAASVGDVFHMTFPPTSYDLHLVQSAFYILPYREEWGLLLNWEDLGYFGLAATGDSDFEVPIGGDTMVLTIAGGHGSPSGAPLPSFRRSMEVGPGGVESDTVTREPVFGNGTWSISNTGLQPVWLSITGDTDLSATSSGYIHGTGLWSIGATVDWCLEPSNEFVASGTGSADFGDPGHWRAAVLPSGPSAVVLLGSAASAATVNLSGNQYIGVLGFDRPSAYAIEGSGTIHLSTMTDGSVTIGSQVSAGQGSHTVDVPTTFSDSEHNIMISASASLRFTHDVAIGSGGRLCKLGEGTLSLKSLSGGCALHVNRGRIEMTSGSAAGSKVNSLHLNIGGTLDIGTSGFVVDHVPGASTLGDFDTPGSIAERIRSAYSGGNWSGAGITSGMANAGTYAVGFAPSTVTFGSLPGSFLGQEADDTASLFRLTRYGDSNLDGVVSIADSAVLSANFGSGNRLWFQGDFNFDGTVNLADYALLAANFNQSVPLDVPRLGSVPECGTSAAIILSLAARTRRRRDSRRRVLITEQSMARWPDIAVP